MAQNYGSIDSIETKENVNNLVKRITNNLQTIRQTTKDLSELQATMGGPHDSASKRDKILQLQRRAKDLLVSTKSLFDTIVMLKIEDETSKLSVRKVKEEYDNVVRNYNEIHEKVIQKMSQMRDAERQSLSVSQPGQDDIFGQQTLQTDDMLSTEEHLKKMQQLERNLLIVQDLYTEINKIVVENREEVEKIEDNVVNAQEDLNMGTQKLNEAIVYKKKALKKKICVIILILVILAIIGLIIGVTVKK